ncbi:gamma-glutamyl-gamma-aminobutyrate hydrolase family protein [Bacteroidota bacterium]
MYKNIKYLPVFLFLSFLIIHCQNPNEINNQETTKIALVNPGVGSFQGFKHLIENKIIDVPNPELIGVVYSKARNNIKNLKRFAEENKYPPIKIKVIEGDLNTDNLFLDNPCSKDFLNIFESTDGILFLGGDDISPSIYNQKTSLMSNTNNPYRHYFELSLLFHLLGGKQDENYQPFLENNPDYVVFGFCLGMQTMNVATGGSLYQDIPQDIYGLKYVEDVCSLDQNLHHRSYWRDLHPYNEEILWSNFHRIKFVENQSFTEKIGIGADELPFVYSSHHQAAKDIGKGFEVIATTIDGKVVEAIAHTKYKNVLGVQFHPEVKALYHKNENKYKLTPDDSVMYCFNEMLENYESLTFHKNYWKHFSQLFSDE